MGQVWQEMNCTQCSVYFSFPLENTFTGVVKVHCGICRHYHQRYVVQGVVQEDGRYNKGPAVMEIDILKSQCYPRSRVNEIREKMELARKKKFDERDAVPCKEGEVVQEMSADDKVRRAHIEELWLDKYANEKFG
jgi:hypothetical protein